MSAIQFLYPPQVGQVSVVIPAFNRKDYIRQTVDSVLNQTHKALELIVVDDGSTDGTLDILKEYGERITLLQHPNGENRGQASALNLGLQHLQGEYIAILDSDDYWSLNYIETMLPFLDKNPECGMAYSNGYAVDETGKVLYDLIKEGHQERNQAGDILLDCYLCLPGESLVRRSVYERVGGFDVSLRAGQDHDMCIRLAENCQLAFNNKPLFHYRKHADTISAKGLTMRWRNGFIILKNALKRADYPDKVVKKRKAVLNYRLAQALKSEHALLPAIYHFMLAGLLDPARALRVITKQEVNY